MAKSIHDDVLDASLSYISTNANKMVACSAEPTTYAEGNATYALADVVPSFTGPANGDTSGRKLTVDAESAVSVDTTGTVTHVCLLDTAASKLLYVTTTASQGVSSGGTVDLGAWDIEIADPA